MTEMYKFPCGCSWPVLGSFPGAPAGALPLLDIDPKRLPSCPDTWELLSRGDTKGIFQLESRLGRQWTKTMKPESSEHMAALGALLRPGCLFAKDEEGVSATQHYCRRKNGEEPDESYHPAVDPILKPTYNVLVFQEQAMEIARVVAGFTLQEADMLRKAIGKKLPEEMAKVKTKFLEGAARTQVVSTEQAEQLFGWIEESQRYSFNKSHAAGYGFTGYETAYLKAHDPVAFYTAWLAYAGEKPDPLQEIYELVNDARLHEIEVLPPDFRTLAGGFSTDGVSVRFGLTDVRGVGGSAIQKVRDAVAATEQLLTRPVAQWTWYEWLVFCSSRLSSSVVIPLISVGAFSWLGLPRRQMLDEYEKWKSLTKKEAEWIEGRELYVRGLSKAEDVLGPAPQVAYPAEELIRDMAPKEQTKLRKAAEKKYQKACDKWNSQLHELTDLTSLGGYHDLAAALRAVARPKAEGGGVANKKRVEAVTSLAYLIEHPPSSLADTPDWIAWTEEQLLGIALTCSRTDAFDISDVNTSCRDFVHGQSGYMILGVTVDQVRECKTKTGKHPGQKMAMLVLSDGTGSVDGAVAFPDAWKAYSGLLTEESSVLIQAERDPKRDGLIIKRVSRMSV